MEGGTGDNTRQIRIGKNMSNSHRGDDVHSFEAGRISIRDKIAEIVEENSSVNGYGFVINGPLIADAILAAVPALVTQGEE
mgnify:CR=1 FL=1